MNLTKKHKTGDKVIVFVPPYPYWQGTIEKVHEGGILCDVTGEGRLGTPMQKTVAMTDTYSYDQLDKVMKEMDDIRSDMCVYRKELEEIKNGEE